MGAQPLDGVRGGVRRVGRLLRGAVARRVPALAGGRVARGPRPPRRHAPASAPGRSAVHAGGGRARPLRAHPARHGGDRGPPEPAPARRHRELHRRAHPARLDLRDPRAARDLHGRRAGHGARAGRLDGPAHPRADLHRHGAGRADLVGRPQHRLHGDGHGGRRAGHPAAAAGPRGHRLAGAGPRDRARAAELAALARAQEPARRHQGAGAAVAALGAGRRHARAPRGGRGRGGADAGDPRRGTSPSRARWTACTSRTWTRARWWTR